MRCSPKEFLASDPLCAPSDAAIAEAFIMLIRRLLTVNAWEDYVSEKICAVLDLAAIWHSPNAAAYSWSTCRNQGISG